MRYHTPVAENGTAKSTVRSAVILGASARHNKNLTLVSEYIRNSLVGCEPDQLKTLADSEVGRYERNELF
jgi:hypothetical protein